MPFYVRNKTLYPYHITYRGVMLLATYNEEIKSIVFWGSMYKLRKWIRNLHPTYQVVGYEIVYRSKDSHNRMREVIVAFVPYTRKQEYSSDAHKCNYKK